MSKVFAHLGRTWEAWPTGTGHGVGAVGVGGALPDINRWGIVIQQIPTNGAEYRAWISAADPAQVAEDELKAVLEEQLVIESINGSRYVWRPAEAIARDTGIDVARVRQILDDSSEVIPGGQNEKGLWLFTTEEHLSRTGGDVMKQVFKVEESS